MKERCILQVRHHTNDNKFPFKNNAEVKDLFLSPFIGCGVATPRQFYLLQKRDTKMLPQNETWKTIEGFNGMYLISSHGRVFSRKTNKLLTGCQDKDGYLRVLIRNGKGSKKFIRVHRLVAFAFVENKDNLPIVDHINGDKSCNYSFNLRWCTSKQNANFDNKSYKTKEGPVKGYRPRKTLSGLPGVYWRKDKRIYEITFCANGSRKHIGYGKSLSECRIKFNKFLESFKNESG